MARQQRGKNCQPDIEMHPHSEYAEAALAAKRECDKVLTFLVDDLLCAHCREELYQTAELLRLVVNMSRKADELWQWALLSAGAFVKMPQDRIDALQEIQLGLAAFLTRKRETA
jgi:hypothetical protein